MLIIFKRYIKKYKKYFREKFTQNRFKDRGDLFQEFSEKGLCKKYILLEIKKSEEERKAQEKNLMNEIKKQ